jgi:hypothetical protein
MNNTSQGGAIEGNAADDALMVDQGRAVMGKVYLGQAFDNTCETPYFHLKFFKKGTLQITFKRPQRVLDEQTWWEPQAQV